MTGKVVRKMDQKGFGFIADESGKEYFFHMTALKNANFDQLEVGTKVDFEARNSPKGLRAEEVTV